jgi:release factor glutamine methyltransferase
VSEAWTIGRLLLSATDVFKERGVQTPRLDAELLLAHVLGVPRLQLYLQHDRPLSDDDRARFRALAGRRARTEPVQYILGEQEFWSLALEVAPGVLIPRADTEILVEEARDEARRCPATRQVRIADVGTGSGAIAIALAHELPEAVVWAGDIAPKALQLAARNAARHGLAERVQVVAADGLLELWRAAAETPFDVVVANPPYIPDGEIAGLMPEVRDWEPREALAGGSDGLRVARRILEEAAMPEVLAPHGAVVLEIGSESQAAEVAGLMTALGHLEAVRIRKDYAGCHRAVVARRGLGRAEPGSGG